ncbi:MAG: hypothetical protein B5M51_01295, partial [Anaerolinea sp. 4484_236]
AVFSQYFYFFTVKRRATAQACRNGNHAEDDRYFLITPAQYDVYQLRQICFSSILKTSYDNI